MWHGQDAESGLLRVVWFSFDAVAPATGAASKNLRLLLVLGMVVGFVAGFVVGASLLLPIGGLWVFAAIAAPIIGMFAGQRVVLEAIGR